MNCVSVPILIKGESSNIEHRDMLLTATAGEVPGCMRCRAYLVGVSWAFRLLLGDGVVKEAVEDDHFCGVWCKHDCLAGSVILVPGRSGERTCSCEV